MPTVCIRRKLCDPSGHLVWREEVPMGVQGAGCETLVGTWCGEKRCPWVYKGLAVGP